MTRKQVRLKRIMEKLEDRVLFDAVPDGGFLLQPEGVQADPLQLNQEMSISVAHDSATEDQQEQLPRELILVDANVADADQIIADILAQRSDRVLEVQLLESNSDGVDQISALLAGTSDRYSAVHVISHGSEGALNLGSTVLDAESLSGYAGSLMGWADGLTEDADLLLYGCNLAGNEAGTEFVELLSSMTGADVAASDDLTGSSEQGGDWELETTVGVVEAQSLHSSNFQGVLLETDNGFVVGDQANFGSIDETAVVPLGQAGVSSRLYANSATASGGAISIDVRLTLINTYDENGNLTAGTANQMPVTFSDFDGGPILLSRVVGSSVSGYEGHTADIVIEFFDNATGNPLSVVGDFTVRDIDYNASGTTGSGVEGFTILDSQLDFYKVSSTPVSQIDVVDNGDGSTTFENTTGNGGPADQERWIGITFYDTTSISMNFQARNVHTGYGLSTEPFSATPIFYGVMDIDLDGDDSTDVDENYLGSFALGQPSSIVDTDVSISSSDPLATVQQILITPGGLEDPANESLTFNGDGATSVSITLNAASNNNLITLGGVTYDIDFDGTQFVISNNAGGTVTMAQAEALLKGTDFQSSSVIPPTIDRTFGVRLTDDNGNATDTASSRLIRNSAPTATDDALSGTENASLSGNVITDDNGSGVDSDPDGDALTVSLVNGLLANVGGNVTGTSGGTFNIASDGSYSFNPGSDFDYLGVGQTVTTQVTYTITDGGATDSATVTVTVTGTNDAPTASGTIADQTNADGTTIAPLDVSGFFADVDTGDSISFTSTTLPPGLSINSTTGVITGTLPANASNGGPYSVTIVGTDGSGASTTQTFTWTVTNPTPTATDDALSGTENASLSGNVITDDNGAGIDSDPDGDALTVSLVNGLLANVGGNVTGTSGGTFNIASDGSYSFNPGSDFDYLGVGQTVTTQVTYTITDGTATDSATVTVTVTGTNDAPTASGTIADQTNADSSTIAPLDVSGFFADADTIDSISFSSTTLPPGLSINSTTGVITGTLPANASNGGPYSVTIVGTDGSGASTTQTFTWTVTNPTPTATDDALSGTENASLSGNVITDDNGSGVDSDPDGDALTVSLVNGLLANVGGNVTGTSGGTFNIASDGSYSFNPGSDFDYLGVGQTVTTQVTYTITDGGATDSATVTVTVTGTNDAPTASGTIADQTNADGTTIAPLDVSGFFADVDTGDSISFTSTTLPPGLSINSTTGVITGTLPASASNGGPYSVTIVGTDGSGASTTQTFTWTVTNPTPTATDDALSGTENASLSGNVITDDNGSGVDSDPDGDALTVSLVNGLLANVGGNVTGTSGGTFNIASDGSYSFNPGSDFDYLGVGQTVTTQVTYTITDGGATDSATVTVTVTGTNDAPTASGTVPNQTNADNTTIAPLDVSAFFADVDTGDSISFTSTTLPPGLSINSTTGVITGTLPANASNGGPYSVTIVGTDGSGASTTQTFTWTVTNPTPTATDDALSGTENASLSGNVITDDNGSGVDSDPDGDALTVSLVNGLLANVGGNVTGTSGGTFNIASDGSYSFNPGSDFDYLGVGQTVTTQVTYTITDGGATDSATVTVTVTGTNDAPTASGTIADQTNADSSTIAPLDVSGFFADVDTGDSISFTSTTLPPGLSINSTTGVITGTLPANASNGGPYSVTIVGTDGSGASITQTFTWTVTNPTPTATNDALSGTENASLSGNVITDDNGSGVDSDPDGDALTVSLVNGLLANVGGNVTGTTGGTFNIASDGSYSFNPGSDFDYLSVGQTVTTQVTYTVTDGTATNSATVTVTVTGTNDAPTASGTIADQTNADGSTIAPLDVSGFFADVDTGDSISFSSTTLPPGLSINSTTGVITGTLPANASNGGPYSVTIVGTDGSGASTTQTFTWTVTNPTPTATDDALSGTENASLSGNVITDDNGSGVDSDPDGDALTVSLVNGLLANVGGNVTGTSGGTFNIASDGSYSFNPGSDFDYLGVGQTVTTQVTYTITDGGATDSATVTVTVTGTNDAPTASGTIADQTNADSTTIAPLDVSGFFADVDTGDSISFTSTTLPPGLSINSTTGVITGTLPANASNGGPYSVTIVGTDGSGASITQTFTWTVTNPTPTATNDALSGTENASLSGNVITDDNGSGVDSDPDGDALTVSLVNGSLANVGGNVTGTSGGTFNIASDGSYTFNPGSDFDYLGVGQTVTTQVTYTITDGTATDSATVTVTVTGTNDAPTASGTIADQTNADGSTIAPLDVSGFFADVDTGDSISFSSTTLPPGLSINSTTGVITGTLPPNASNGGPYSVTIVGTDGSGASTTQTFTWTVTNPTPTATDDALSGTENASLSGNVITDDNGAGIDSDPDGDALTVSLVNGSLANVGGNVTGTSGGTFNIASDGSYTFNPGSDFDYLSVGQTVTTQVTYTVTDGTATDSATVTVTVTGTNDAPTASGTVPDQTNADSTTIAPLDVSAFFADVDTGDSISFTSTTLPPGLSINSTTGVITGTLPANASNGGPYSVTIVGTDGSGASITQTFTWTVTNPTPTATNDALSGTENASLSGNVITDDNGSGVDSDPDGDALTVSLVNGSLANVGGNVTGTSGGTFNIASDGSYTFNPGSDFDYLGVGQTVTTQVTYTITDGTATDSATVTVTVTGTNDAPTASGTIADQTNADGSTIAPLDVSGFFADADTIDSISFSSTTLPPGLSINSTTGVITGTLPPNASNGGPYSVTIVGTDGSGASTTQTFTWTVTNPTPTATDDALSGTENASLSGNVITDDNGAGIDSDPDGDALTVSLVNGLLANVGGNVTGTSGGTFNIAADGSYTFNPGSDFDYLSVGQTVTTQVTYTVTDGTATDSATVTVTVTGTNDAPTASGTVPNQTNADNTTIAPLDVSAFFADVDTGDSISFTSTTLPPGLSINSTTGVITGTLPTNASNGGPYSVTIVGTDGSGASTTQTFTWTVTNPTPTATDDALSGTENASLSGNIITDDNGTGVDSDPDGDALTVSLVNGLPANVGGNVTGTSGGTFNIASDGSYTFNPGSDFDYLGVGQTVTTQVTYTITDGTATDSATVTVTVTGTNDAPTASGTVPNQTNADNTTIAPLDVSAFFADADTIDSISFSSTTLPPGLSINSTTGVITGTLPANASNGGPYSVTIVGTDGSGASTTQTFTWIVTNPTPTATDDALSGTENASLSGNVITDDNGSGVDSDPDGDALTVSLVNGSLANVGGNVTGTSGGTFNIAADGSYSFNPGSDFDYLGVGQTVTTQVTYTVTDGTATDSATVTVTVTGTNDAPTASGTIADQTNADSSTIAPLDVSGFFADADLTDSISFTSTTLPPGLSINSTTGVITGTLPANASNGGPYSVTIVGTDGSGASTTQTFTWTVTNPTPTATDDALSGTENASLSGNVITDDNGAGVDSDPDGDALTVSLVNGSLANVGGNVTGTSGGTFNIASDGSYTFNPGSDFDYLGVGQTVTTQVTYSVTDGTATDSATVTVTVTGTNDAPTASGTIADQTNADSSTIAPLDVSGFFADVDTGDSISFTSTTLPPGLSINSTTGVITGTLPANASNGGPYSVTIVGTDGSGASTTQTFTWTVTNPTPTATDDALSGTENASLSGNVITDDNGPGVDSDPDGDALTVSLVNGLLANVGGNVTGTSGGTFNIASDGSYTFNPGSDFDYLGVGQTVTTQVTYTVTDGTATNSATVTVTVTGTNDAPTASGTIADQTNADSSTIAPLDVSGFFADADTIDSISFSSTTLPPGLSINSMTGVITGTLPTNASNGGPYSVTIVGTDGSGASTTQTFTWTVTNPTPTATDDALSGTENASLSGNVITDDNGSGVDSDPDGDALTVSLVNGLLANVGGNVTGTSGGTFNIASDGSYTFNPGSDFDYLGVGQTVTTQVTYTVTDGTATDSATVTVTVTGTNDAPTASGTIADQTNADSSTIAPLDVSGFFADADLTDSISFTSTTLPPGLSINSTTGVITGTLPANASNGGPYSVTIVGTDGSGASTTQTFTWTVTNPVPIATDDALSGTENAPLSGNVMTDDNGSGVDSDPEGDPLTISLINGLLANVGGNVTGTSGGTFNIASDGSYTFNPGSDFDYLSVGQTVTTQVTYTVTDGTATDSATVTVTVTGTNDAPTASGTIADQTNADNTTIAPLDVSGFFADADLTDSISFSSTTLPPGLSINSTTGVITGTLPANASNGGPYSVTIVGTDGSGASTTQTFTWTVTNPTPTATDDALSGTENASLSGNVITDDNGSGVDSDPDGDALTVSLVNGLLANVGGNVTGTSGGTFNIASDGSYSFNPGSDFDYLSVGQTVTTQVTYTVTDGTATNSATVTVTVTGTNDAPTASGTIADQTNADSSTIAPLDVSGFFADADLTDSISFSSTTLPPGLSINSTTGVITGTLPASASNSGPYSVTIVGTDGSGASTTQIFTWTVTNPTPTATDDALSGTENASLSGNVITDDNGPGVDSDPDGDALTVSLVNGSLANVGGNVTGTSGGTFNIASDGSYTFNPGSDFDYLGVGQTVTTQVTYTVTDGTATNSATVTVTVTGTNDAPTSSGTIADQTNADNTTIAPLDVSSFFADADLTDSISFSSTTLPPGLSINSMTGVITGTLPPNASNGGPYSVTIVGTDGSGASTTQIFTWTVTNPTPTATDDALSGTENASLSGNVITDDNGSGVDSDPDGDALTVSLVNGLLANVGGNVTGTSGGTFNIASDGSYTFNPGSDFDYLGVGQTVTTQVTYTVTDGTATDSATVTVTVTGTNDAPTASGTIADQTNADSSTIAPLDVSGFFADADLTDSISFTSTTLPPGLSINSTTGVITGTLPANASNGGPYSVTIVGTDGSGASTTQTFTWTVTNPTPTATDDALSGTENASLSGNVITDDNGSGVDSDPDGDALTVSLVNGSLANVGGNVTGTSGGTFNIAADGSYTFNPGSDFDYLGVGQTVTTQVTYTITDGTATDSATVTVTVTGTNDAPTASGTIADQTNADSTTIAPLDVSGFFADVDTGDSISFTSTTLPPGLSINSTTGVITGTLPPNASDSGPYSVTIVGTDGSGASTTQIFTWTVTNPTPTATDDALSGTENASLSGNVITDDNGSGVDSDPDGDALTVSLVNGLLANVGGNVTGTSGGTFNIASDGSYSFNPGSDFDYLGVGQTVTTQVTYTITDGGATDSATVTVTVTGTNDAPTASGTIADQTGADSTTIAPLDVSGFFADADLTDSISFSSTTLPPGLSINSTTGVITGTLPANASNGGPYSVTIVGTDGSGASTTQIFTWTVTNPTPTATDDALSGTENASLSGNVITDDNGAGVDSDPDGDALTVSLVNGLLANVGGNVTGTSGGTFNIASDGSYTFNPGSDFDYLGIGQTVTTQVTYTVTDGTATNSATVIVTVTGTNDAPTTSGTIADQTNADNTTIAPLDVSGFFADADLTDSISFTSTTLPPGLSINSTTGVITGTLPPNASDSGPYSVTIVGTDGSGAATTQTFTWIVTNPTPTATDDALSGTENASLSGNVITDDNGSGVDSDPDGDALTVSLVNGSLANVGGNVTGTSGGTFNIASDGSYTFNPDSDFDYLGVGQTVTTQVTYTVTDGTATNSATVTVTVTGTNDAPTASGTIADQTNADNTTIAPLDVSGFFADADLTDSISFTSTTLPPGLSINSTTGVITGTLPPNASDSGPYSVTIVGTDGSGASTTQTFTWTVTNPTPTATDDALSGTENASLSGNVITDDNGPGVDSDPDGDTLTVSLVNGLAANVGASIAGSAGGSFTIASDGSYSFNPGGDFDYLGAGQTATTQIQYTVSDGTATDTAIVTVTVTGTNDTPTATGTVPDQSGVDSTTIAPLDVSGFFSDIDTGDSITFTSTTLPPGLNVNLTTGVISGTFAASASAGGPYSVTIIGTDTFGETATQTFTWSVTNPTPTANDDALSGTENASLSGNVITVDNGSGIDSDPDGDALSVSLVNGLAANVGSSVAGSGGGSFSIASDGSYTFNPGSDFDYLGAGQTATTQILYTITDGMATDTAVVTVTVTGTNDSPTPTGTIPGQTNADNTTIAPLDVSGYFADVDTGDSISYTSSTLPPGLSINSTTGVITGTLPSNASDSGPYSVTITGTDLSGAATTQTFTWTVTNAVPIATDDAFAGTENASLSGNVINIDNGSGVDSDPDGDPLTVGLVNGMLANVGSSVTGTGGGSFVINSDGSYTFNPGSDFDYLAAGETATTQVTYSITDGTSTDTATVTVTVTGTNDTPTAAGTVPDQISNDGATIAPLDVSGYLTDSDLSDSLTFTSTTLPPGLIIDSSTGVITGTLPGNASDSGPYTVTVTGTDGAGAAASQTFTWTVNNPAPTATDDALAATENASLTGNVITDNNGSGVDNDPDGDALSVNLVNGLPANVGASVTGTNGGTFIIGSDGTYTFAPASDFDYLAAGDTTTTQVTYTVTDGDSTDTATVTVTITGTNDAPTAVGTIANQTNADGTTIAPLDVSGSFGDVDASDSFTFSSTTLPPGLSLNVATGVITGTLPANASNTGPYSVTITATDPAGAATTQTFTWTVTNPAPIATDDALSGTENASLTGNVITDNNGSGVDTDPDGDALTVAEVNGQPTKVGMPVTGTGGGVFTINSDGTYSFVPGTDFDHLNAGQLATTEVTYTISDGTVTDTATVTVTVTGTNDTPTASGTIPPQSNIDSTTIVPLDVSGFFADVDSGDTIAFTSTTLPLGLSIDSSTGMITGRLSANASDSGPYSVIITGTDALGASTSQTFTWTVTNPPPTAQDDALGGTENSSLSGNVITDDNGSGVDADPDGDALSVAEVNGNPANVGASVTGTGGGTFTIDASGAYTFDPGTDFDHLAAGVTATTQVTYTVTDGSATDTATVTVTVTGTNDAPTTTGTIADQTSADAMTIAPLNVSSFFADADTGDSIAFTSSMLPPGLSIDATTGVITGTLASNASDGGPYTVSIIGTDTSGATVTQTFDWTVTDPAPIASDDSLGTIENASLTGNVITDDNGAGVDVDPDGDTISVSEVDGAAGNVGSSVVGTGGGTFTIASDGTYSFNPGSDFDYLAAGETATTQVTYTITDGKSTDTAVVTVTVTGTNDNPTVMGAISDQSGVDGTVIAPLDASAFFDDPDATDSLVFSVGGTLPPGLTIDSVTGIISGTFDTSASAGGPYTVVVTVTDPTGASTSQTFDWSVANLVPTATDDSIGTTENVSFTTNLIVSNGIDFDSDGDTISVVEINGDASLVGIAFTGSGGGSFVVDSNGDVSFNPGTAFDYLAVGQTTTTSFTYTIEDADGLTDTATVTVTVTGTNDNPTATGMIPNQSGNDGDTIAPMNVSTLFGDVDAIDTLQFTDGGTLPPGLSIDLNTGTITGTIAPNASLSGPYTVTITASDGNGGSIGRTFTWVVALAELPSQVDTAGEGIDPVDVSGPFSGLGAGTTYTDGGTLPPGLSIDPTTGIVTGTLDDDSANSTPYVVTITGTNGGTTVSQDFHWTVNPKFAFDSFRDDSEEEKQSDRDRLGFAMQPREVLLSRALERMGSEPILSGYASPGTVLVGRIYDANGSIVGESTLTVGPSGNWTMHFFGTQQTSNTRVVIEHVATENVALGSSALKLSGSTYRALQLDASSAPSTTAGTVLDGTPHATLETSHGQNMNPLGLL